MLSRFGVARLPSPSSPSSSSAAQGTDPDFSSDRGKRMVMVRRQEVRQELCFFLLCTTFSFYVPVHDQYTVHFFLQRLFRYCGLDWQEGKFHQPLNVPSLPRKVSVEIFRCNYRPSQTESKKMPVTTPVFGAQKGKKKHSSPKNIQNWQPPVCLRRLDGSFCDIKTGLKTDPF